MSCIVDSTEFTIVCMHSRCDRIDTHSRCHLTAQTKRVRALLGWLRARLLATDSLPCAEK